MYRFYSPAATLVEPDSASESLYLVQYFIVRLYEKRPPSGVTDSRACNRIAQSTELSILIAHLASSYFSLDDWLYGLECSSKAVFKLNQQSSVFIDSVKRVRLCPESLAETEVSC